MASPGPAQIESMLGFSDSSMLPIWAGWDSLIRQLSWDDGLRASGLMGCAQFAFYQPNSKAASQIGSMLGFSDSSMLAIWECVRCLGGPVEVGHVPS